MKFLNPCNDVAFKKIFGSEEHKAVTISFLNSILEYTGKAAIVEIKFLNTEQKRIMQLKKDNILDILCTDQAGKQYLVEVQVESVKAFGKRIVFYGAKTYAMQLGAAQAYTKLEPIVAISVLDFIMFPKKKDYKSIHLLLDKKTYEHDLKELSFAFIELPKFNKKENELETNEDKWIYFLKNINKQDHVPAPLQENEFGQACQAAERMTWSEEEFNAYEDAIVRATDIQGSNELAFEKGEKKGENKKAIEIATTSLKAGLDVHTISKITGLSIEDVESLKTHLIN